MQPIQLKDSVKIECRRNNPRLLIKKMQQIKIV